MNFKVKQNTFNELDLLPYEYKLLRLILDKRPEYLFLKYPEDYWVGDEIGVLSRHGTDINFAPFSREFYGLAEKLLNEKTVSIPFWTSEERKLLENSERFTVTKKDLMNICVRHGIRRYFNGVSENGVSISSPKEIIVEALKYHYNRSQTTKLKKVS